LKWRSKEFHLRREVLKLSTDLVGNGWAVLSSNLQKLFLDRVRNQEEGWVEKVIRMERETASTGATWKLT
jgi:hypothetical protein